MTKKEQLHHNKPPKETKQRFRKCKYCGDKAVPYGAIEPFCFEIKCISKHNEKTKTQAKRKAKEEFNKTDKSKLTKDAQYHFNKFIRTRDKGQPCISCGHTGNRQIHAGHFMPVGANGHIRFDEANCHAQCSICNNHKSGNLTEYEPNLVKKIGQEEVNRLKRKVTRSYTVEELQGIIATYKQKTKALNE